eukprot:4327206-Heterocapsa_arctica.AAC.1
MPVPITGSTIPTGVYSANHFGTSVSGSFAARTTASKSHDCKPSSLQTCVPIAFATTARSSGKSVSGIVLPSLLPSVANAWANTS